MKQTLFLILVVVLSWSHMASAQDTPLPDITSERTLDEAIAQLTNPEAEIPALQRLITFSGLHLYEGSGFFYADNTEMTKLRRKAAKAVQSRRQIETVKKTLEHQDRNVRFWGVISFEFRYDEKKPWEALLPRLKEIAVEDPDAGIRRVAISKLRCYESGRTFLSELQNRTKESAPDVLMMLFEFDSQSPELRARFYAKAIEFLSHDDETVRAHWLCDVLMNARNPFTAPMWRIEADPLLVAKLKQLKQNGTPKERELAGETLNAVLKKREDISLHDVSAESSNVKPITSSDAR